jgi:cation diffusion facilitator family transporter
LEAIHLSEKRYEKIKNSEKGVWLNIIIYFLLAVLKVSIGLLANSKALLADGLNNTTDIIASIALLVGLKISKKPPDKDHPYGHFRAETIASLLSSLIIAMVGIQIIINSIPNLFKNNIEKPDLISAWVALISAIIISFVYIYNRKLGKKNNNQTLLAASQDNKSDAIISIGTFIGVIGSNLGLHLLDPIIATLIGIVVCKTAWGIFKHTAYSLSDGFNDENKLMFLKTKIEIHPNVIKVKEIRARTHANDILIDVIIYVEPEITVTQSHVITDDIEDVLLKEYEIGNVHIHVEPYI